MNKFSRRKPTKKLILNIGPGSSGTRSLYLAATQLNITAYHLGASSVNCISYSHHRNVSLGPLFNIHTMEIMNGGGGGGGGSGSSSGYDEFAFWGDIPVPNDWWSLMHGPLEDRILYVMTDMDDNKWVWTMHKIAVCMYVCMHACM